MQVFEDGQLHSSSFELRVFSTEFYHFNINGKLFYRRSVTHEALEKIVSHIQMAYPSVSHIDHAVIATWYRVTNTQLNNGKVSSHIYCIVFVQHHLSISYRLPLSRLC